MSAIATAAAPSGARSRADGAAPASTRAVSIRRELLASTAVLFVAAILVAVAAAGVLIPVAQSPMSALLALTVILLAELLVLFGFLHSLLGRIVVEPIDRIVGHAERIAGGELEVRIPRDGSEELNRIVDSVNTLASQLIAEQQALAENVVSLDRTNQELSDTSRELVRAARLASVGTLAAGVAHEIGNPLGALRGYLDVALNRTREGRDVEEMLGAAGDEVERIDGIVRHILAFGNSRDTAPELPVLNPVPVVERVVEDVRSQAGLGAEVLALLVEEDLPCVRAQPEHVERALANLLKNARQASRRSGNEQITVRVRSASSARRMVQPRRAGDPDSVDYSHRRRLTSLLEVNAPPPADAGDRDLVIEVVDRGPGIAEEHLARLFDPFFTTGAPGEGTGMGLALTARILGELGGFAEAENVEGGGALFRLRFPGVEKAA